MNVSLLKAARQSADALRRQYRGVRLSERTPAMGEYAICQTASIAILNGVTLRSPERYTDVSRWLLWRLRGI